MGQGNRLLGIVFLGLLAVSTDGQAADNRQWQPENKDCTVNFESRYFDQDPVYLAGFRVGSGPQTEFQPYAKLVCPGGAAELAGMREGDILLSLGTTPPTHFNAPAVEQALATTDVVTGLLFFDRGYPLIFTVMRDKVVMKLAPLIPRKGSEQETP